MEWWNLGVGIGGFIVGMFGLRFAFLAHQSATLAKSAASSAEDAANEARIEARQTLRRNRTSVEVGRAIELLNRLKDVHRQGSWAAALWLYQDLRRTLSEIRASMPADLEQFHDIIDTAVPQVTAMENQVDRDILEGTKPEEPQRLNMVLTEMQQELETLQGKLTYRDRGGN